MSAINIPDVVKILRYHGLVPVPVDIESDTLEMRTDLLEQSITKRTCMVLVAFLYGTWYDLGKIHEVA
jgi:dTDP-4-amino-4,6-dideoxygalactose transaminase